MSQKVPSYAADTILPGLRSLEHTLGKKSQPFGPFADYNLSSNIHLKNLNVPPTQSLHIVETGRKGAFFPIICSLNIVKNQKWKKKVSVFANFSPPAIFCLNQSKTWKLKVINPLISLNGIFFTYSIVSDQIFYLVFLACNVCMFLGNNCVKSQKLL